MIKRLIIATVFIFVSTVSFASVKPLLSDGTVPLLSDGTIPLLSDAGAVTDGDLAIAANNTEVDTKWYATVTVNAAVTGTHFHYCVIDSYTGAEDVDLDHCTMRSLSAGSGALTCACVKFAQSYAEILALGYTIVDKGGVEYEIDCKVLSNGRLANPRCNRCEGDE